MLAGCDLAPLSSAWQLRGVDPVTTDAGGLRVAVALPAALSLRAGGVQMRGQVRGNGGVQDYRFALVPASVPPALDVDLGQQLRGYRLTPDGVAQFDAFRAAAARVRATGGGGSLSVDAPLCRDAGWQPTRVPLSAYLKTVELERYVLLMQTQDILSDTDLSLDALVPLCGA